MYKLDIDELAARNRKNPSGNSPFISATREENTVKILAATLQIPKAVPRYLVGKSFVLAM